ncbi:MAG: DUF1491 family protein [Rhodospirillales bacterium]|nr:DUF1491 family protein [Rhodospirillales bacterium]
MAEPRLKTHIWVQAQVRLLDVHSIPVAVTKRGDPDAGAVLMRLLRPERKCLLVRRHTRPDGSSGWMAAGGGGAMDDAAADAQIAREIWRDPDLWVIEVDDPKERYWPDRSMG